MGTGASSTARDALPSPLRVIGGALIWLAVVAALFAVYQVWGTGRYTARAQQALAMEFDAAVVPVATRGPTPTTTATPTTTPAATSPATTIPTTTIPTTTIPTTTIPTAAEPAAKPAAVPAAPGAVIGRLLIDSLDLDWYVVEGVEHDHLRNGPGRYPSTAPLGGGGNVAVAGHRTTYGAPFARLDELVPGDEITVLTPMGALRYRVMDPAQALAPWLEELRGIGPGHAVVAPTDTFVLADMADDRLTLTACHPRFSAEERIVVVAELIDDPPSPIPSVAATTPEPTPATAPPSDPDLSEPERMATTQTPTAPPTDLGLRGLDEALAPTVILGLLSAVVTAAISVMAVRLGRLRAVLIGLVPLAVSMWLFFVQLDRLLPAY